MKRLGLILLVLAAVAISVAGCGTTPCQDYCQTFADKIQKCSLGGPGQDALVQECEDGISESNSACTMDAAKIDGWTCDQFKTVICQQQSDGQAMFNCGD